MASSHKLETGARRKPRAVAVLGSFAVLATVGVVGAGMVTHDSDGDLVRISSTGDTAEFRRDPPSLSRSADRAAPTTPATPASTSPASAVPAQGPTQGPVALKLTSRVAVRAAVAGAHERRWTSAALDLWTRPDAKARHEGEIQAGDRVLVTGRHARGRSEIVVKGRSRWVTAGYLTEAEPAGAGAGLSHEPCPDGSVEDRLTAGAIYVYRSVCHAFPQITSYGGWAPRGEHASGKAIDIMTSDVALGTAIATFLQEHAAELDLYDIIWRQHIWTPVRASEGWRLMSSRGSETANHDDHVHVSVN